MKHNDLNERQKEAVEYVNGPLLILAGPGSGKTRVITHKIAYLIEKNIARPEEILAITFTNKAAREMKERVISLVGDLNIQISTFHSFGVRIIRENYNILGLNSKFSILDDKDSLSLIEKTMKSMNLDSTLFNTRIIRDLISSCKNDLIGSKEYEKFVHSNLEKINLQIYRKYQEELKKTSSVDFGDLLMLPVILFKNNKHILEKYQERYKYIFIDEYQDTNEAQYVLSKLIASKYKNICVVGDESQNIYSWRGANYKNIMNFEDDYKDSKVILLEQNYRSTKTILNIANAIIKNNIDRKDKTLFTQNEEGNKIKYMTAFNERDEAVRLANEILDNKNYKEIAVLYRTNAQSREIEEVLIEKGIPYKIIGDVSYYERKEIKDLMAYLKLVNNLNDDTSLLRIINVPKRGIGAKSVEKAIILANEKRCPIFEVLKEGKELEFKNIILDLKEKSDKKTLTEFIKYLFDKTKIKEEYTKTIDGISRVENLDEFLNMTIKYEEEHGNVLLEDYLLEKSLSKEKDSTEIMEEVLLMTLHSAKGLEFDVVFIVGVEEDLLPHFNSTFTRDEIEEERRLFYVGITRARKEVYLLNTKQRQLYSKIINNKPSRFIEEIDESDILYMTDVNRNFKIKEKFYKEKIEYYLGENIKHDVFGKGTIVKMDDDTITIAFSKEIGIKTLLKNHTSIKKQ